MLDYVGSQVYDLRRTYRDKVAAAQLPAEEARRLNDALEAGLTGYTYLDDTPQAKGAVAGSTRRGGSAVLPATGSPASPRSGGCSGAAAGWRSTPPIRRCRLRWSDACRRSGRRRGTGLDRT